MANFFLCACIFRIALPFLILTCALFRPCLLSGIYLLLLLCSSLLSVPTEKSMAVSIPDCIGSNAAVRTFYFLVNCTMPETLLTYCGFVRLDKADGVAITTWIAPEVVMLLSSLVTYTVCKKLTAINTEIVAEGGEAQVKIKQKRSFGFWVSVAKYIGLISLCVAAVLRPSVPGAFYFLVFIGSCTWWACYRELEKGFAIVCRIVMVVVFLHIICLYTYQLEWFQEQLPLTSPYIKYLGIQPLYNTSCEHPWDIVWMPIQWDSYINPLALIWLFYILAIVSRNMLKPKMHLRDSDSTMNERTPLMRGVSPSRKYGAGIKNLGSNITQDSIGSVTVSDNPDDIPLYNLEEEEEEEKPGCFEHAVFIVESIIQFIIQSSYVVTNIIMMTWSITYHSWLTFVLLLWANILWMIPNQRRSMLRSSPVLICYAIFLLLSAYVYSMDIDELPTTIYGISMEQIGFIKVTEFPWKPLIVKCLFTVMFWITMRQHMKEIKEARQSTTLAEMAAPLQVSVTAATGVTKEQQEQETQILQSIGQYMKKFLSRVWIWIVAITLFAVAITGERMTAFRIFYMALFLFFIITFQLSFKLWKRVMFGFWLTVIIYSMTILILVYTYQFHDFDNYWYEYLRIPKELQLDIGLEKYNQAQLFVRLATPTFFVIVTVVQLHYFHNDFILYSTPTVQPTLNPTSEEGSSVQGNVLEQNKEKDDVTDTSDLTSLKIDLTDIGNVSGKHILHKINVLIHRLQQVINFVFLFLEIHMHKLVIVLAMLMSIYDSCALYCIVILLGIIGLTSGRKVCLFVIYFCSVFVSCMLLARMVYQIQYIKHDYWNATCPINSTSNISLNIAEWIGFQKTMKGRSLPKLVQWNIGYILGVTLYTVVLVRQLNYKLRLGQPTTRLFFMFPGVTYKDKHTNLMYALKYVCNYGFYRFGVELSLMATVALIGFRMDLYAMVYAAWLCFVFALRRSVLSKVWHFYMWFIAIFIPIQYVMIVGFPAIHCIDFPWNDSIMLRELQEWAYLMDYQYPPAPQKLVLDVILLLFVSRQAVVFRLEKKYKDQDYPGGSNESIIHNAEAKDFENPAPDFITFARSYLDIVTRIIYLGWMWLTLAIVFLAGANRVNLFSVGYLIGSFIFLWQGSDIYLKPIPKILRLWNCLLGYNVFVIFFKTILQMVACVFIINFGSHCWAVQLLGIGCVRKFVITSKETVPNQCEVSKDYIGLVWDGICFGFLIIQRRIFCSYGFFHVIDETKATTILASRGAELIEQLRQKRMHEQDEQERRILEKIKAKMDRIKATQQKLQGPFTSTENHYVDDIYPNSSRPLYRKWQPKTYKQAVRSGDYYMFDDLDDDEDLEMIEELQPEHEDMDDDDGSPSTRKRTLGELLSTALKTDIGTTIRTTSDRDLRRASMPRLGRQRSIVSGRSQYSAPLSAPPIIEETRGRSESSPSSKDKRSKPEFMGPIPGTSKEEELSEITEPKESKCQKIVDILLFIWAFIDSALVSLTNRLNQYSRDYRYVLKVLGKEKKEMKQTSDYTEGIRMGRDQKWQPASSYRSLLHKSHSHMQIIHQKLDEYDTGELSSHDQPTIIRFLLSIWYIILSHSDILCFFAIFLNQVRSATFLSLPLPLMVFFWGTLTVPRPSKNFWITIIAYTQLIVLIKCVFQFDFLPWNSQTLHGSSINPAKIFGVERRSQYAAYDLILLLVVYFHRYMLKCLGLWKTTVIMLPSYSDGAHMVDDGDVHPLRRVDRNSPISIDDEQQITRTSNPRRNSDLERLVEENEHEEEQEDEVSTMAEYRVDNVCNVTVKNKAVYDMFPDTLKMAPRMYLQAIKDFFTQLRDPSFRVAVDVYSYMFMCDFFNFFVILVGYSSFGTQQSDGGVSSYLEDNRVPLLFLLMLILQFMLIIVDRAIFLRKHISAKIIFQFVQIIVLHIWLFILFPVVTERTFISVIPPQMYYMVKCFYLLLSAYQIRCGYPSRILGNVLCKGYNYVNMFLFKGFMMVPFLFELRTVMDWMWTDTSMTIFDWIKMEDIFAHVFQLKCTRHVEDEFPQPRGQKKSPNVKYLTGGVALFVIIAIIWFPLVFFSLGNAVGEPNPPVDVTLELRIGPYEPVYHLSAQSNAIHPFTESEVTALVTTFKSNRYIIDFVNNYEHQDIVAIKLSRDSANLWSISPPDRQRMINEISSNLSISVRLQYIITHKSNQDRDVIRDENVFIMPPTDNGQPNIERLKLLEMLNSNTSVDPVKIGYILPKFLKVTNRGTAKPVPHMMDPEGGTPHAELRNISLKLRRDELNSELEWWEIQEECNDTIYIKYLSSLPYEDCSSIMLYAFNDKIFPEALGLITAGGIIGLYTTFVFLASRVLRGFFGDICFKIMFEDMPNIDRVLQLCLDIYLVREAREFCLEEDLFAKLVFLFRSPETLIKWTRPKEELGDDEDPEGVPE
ncbi:Piezo [Popillia japonica]|uniref:Piezo n=1 Tax=Popillia japonica TaxID=7064 RepID=A0AAW1LB10_POPJA